MIQENKKIDEYYNALINKDSHYVGVFYVGVKTTGIFCISTCTARKPKRENVEFYKSTKEALQHGYRPCKVCKPSTKANEVPESIQKLIKEVSKAPERKIKDYDLRNMGLDPVWVRRWFNSNHGITFQAYQRMIRINTAYHKLKNGEQVTSSAFDSGFESLSGFGSAFKNTLSDSPSSSKDMNVINLKRFNTKLGPMYAGATEKGLCMLEFTDRRMLETEFEDLSKRLKAKIIVGENDYTKEAEKQIQEYFEGIRKTFEIELDTPGTDFQKQVWKELQSITYGETRSYKNQAVHLGNPEAVRAVARANGMNRVAIIIPCHRVIGSDGSLTGYAGGLARKEWLLDHEGAIKQKTIF